VQADLFGEPTRDLGKSQLFTPIALARRMAELVPRTARVLEPSCGTGNLIEGLLRAGHDPRLITGVERDAEMAAFAFARFQHRVDIIVQDFHSYCRLSRSHPFDLVLMNPPYEENEHMRFVLEALDVAPTVVGLFPTDFEATQERDAKLWAVKGSVTHRITLPERVKFSGQGGQNEHAVLRINRREHPRRYGEVRHVVEETWRPGDGPLEHMAEVP
jgi:predicted RNA methylase